MVNEHSKTVDPAVVLTGLLTDLVAAFDEKATELHDRYGRGLQPNVDQRILLRSELMSDIADAIRLANAERQRLDGAERK